MKIGFWFVLKDGESLVAAQRHPSSRDTNGGPSRYGHSGCFVLSFFALLPDVFAVSCCSHLHQASCLLPFLSVARNFPSMFLGLEFPSRRSRNESD